MHTDVHARMFSDCNLTPRTAQHTINPQTHTPTCTAPHTHTDTPTQMRTHAVTRTGNSRLSTALSCMFNVSLVVAQGADLRRQCNEFHWRVPRKRFSRACAVWPAIHTRVNVCRYHAHASFMSATRYIVILYVNILKLHRLLFYVEPMYGINFPKWVQRHCVCKKLDTLSLV